MSSTSNCKRARTHTSRHRQALSRTSVQHTATGSLCVQCCMKRYSVYIGPDGGDECALLIFIHNGTIPSLPFRAVVFVGFVRSLSASPFRQYVHAFIDFISSLPLSLSLSISLLLHSQVHSQCTQRTYSASHIP